ncbi:MAG TPA: hypothetical protein PK402_14225, partial [Tepidisphaeraceae bacterium]|nr:hypothetical protein [Tepidisphaeraceae bacterium]
MSNEHELDQIVMAEVGWLIYRGDNALQLQFDHLSEPSFAPDPKQGEDRCNYEQMVESVTAEAIASPNMTRAKRVIFVTMEQYDDLADVLDARLEQGPKTRDLSLELPPVATITDAAILREDINREMYGLENNSLNVIEIFNTAGRISLLMRKIDLFKY